MKAQWCGCEQVKLGAARCAGSASSAIPSPRPENWRDWLQVPAHRIVAWRQWTWQRSPGDKSDFHERSAVAALFGGIAALDLIDLIETSDGIVRALSWQLQELRVRRLTLRYVAVSRFWNYFVKNDGKAAAQPAGRPRQLTPRKTDPLAAQRTTWQQSVSRGP